MAQNDEDPPWLAEATPAGGASGGSTQVSRRSLFWTLTALLALTAIAVVGLVLLLGRKEGGSTQGYMEAEQAPLIEADVGPYKVPPADRQGLQVAGEGDVIYEAGEGLTQGSVIDESAVPEEPIGRPRDLLPDVAQVPAGDGTAPATIGQPAPKPPTPPQLVPVPVVPPTSTATPKSTAPSPTAATAKPAPAKPLVTTPPAPPPAAKTATPPVAKPAAPAPAKPAAGAGVVQLGAFSTAEKAEAEWTRLAGRAGLSGKRIEPVTRNGKTLYRLRGSASDVAVACQKLTAAGGACSVVK